MPVKRVVDLRTGARTRRTIVAVLATLIVVPIVVVGGYFLWYVEAAPTPLDEIGIDLNAAMPKFIQTWACNRIATRFPGNGFAPYPCPQPKR